MDDIENNIDDLKNVIYDLDYGDMTRNQATSKIQDVIDNLQIIHDDIKSALNIN